MAQRRLSIVLDLDTGAYSGRLAQAGGQMQQFGGKVRETAQHVNKTGDAIERLGHTLNRPRAALRDWVLTLGNLHFALLNIQTIAVGWIAALVKQSAEVERLTVLMKGLSHATTEAGRAQEAQQNLKSLFQLARESGMEVKSLTDGFVKMKSVGIDPMNGSLKSLVGAVANFGGTSDQMHRATIAIQQMAGKGVISMEELRQQLGEAIPTAISDMARALGKTVPDFVKEVSKGKVQAKPALEAMFKEFEMMYGGSGARIANTLNGQLAEFRTNLTELSTDFTGLGQGDSLFKGITDSLKEINAAMRSGEGRQFMSDLGVIIKDVMSGLMSVGRFIVQWRSEIGTVIYGIVAGFAAMKAVQIVQWFVQLGTLSVAALRSTAAGAVAATGPMASLTAATTRYAAEVTAAATAERARVSTAALQRSASAQQIASLTQESMALRTKSAAITHNINLLRQQRLAEIQQLNNARTLHAANLAAGRSGVQSANNVAIAQTRLNQTNAALIRSRAQLRAVTAQAAATEVAFTGAVNAAAAAQGQLNVKTTLATRALGLKAAAARAAGVAVSFMGRAMSIALGPIGMIAMMLLSAAHAAGVFENRARRAAAAARELARGVADAQKLQEVVDKKRENDDIIARAARPENRFLSGLQDAARRAREENKQLAPAIDMGRNSLARQGGEEGAGLSARYREDFRAGQSAQYRNFVRQTEQKHGAGSATSRRLIAAERARLSGQNNKYDELTIRGLEQRRDAATNPVDKARLTRQVEATREAFGMTTDLTDATNDLTQAQGANAAAADKSTGSTKKLTEAEKEAKREATAAEAAHERFGNMMTTAAGEVESLEDQLHDGQGALAKFNGQLEASKDKNGKYSGKFEFINEAEITKLRALYAEIDKRKAQLDGKRSLDALKADLTEAQNMADAMWRAVGGPRGSWDKELRDTQLASQLQDRLKGVTDEGQIAEIKRDHAFMVLELNRQAAAETTRAWNESAEDIKIDLMDERAAREATFQREVEIAHAKLDLTNKGTAERRAAEEAYYKWKEQRELQLARQNEHSVTKMMRDWYKLGDGIQDALAGSLDGFINDLAEGKASFGDFAKSLIKDLLKIILKAIIAWMLLSALGLGGAGYKDKSLGSFLTDGFKQGFGIGGPEKKHGGGWIGSQTLKPGEVPLVGKDDEVVLTRSQQSFYGKALDAALTGGGTPNVEVNIINNSGTAVTAQQGDPRLDGKNMIIDVVVEAMHKQGPLRDSVQQIVKK